MLEERFQQLLAAVAVLSDMTGVLPRCCERGIESSCVHMVPILSHTLLLDIKVSKFYQQDSHRHVSFWCLEDLTSCQALVSVHLLCIQNPFFLLGT